MADNAADPCVISPGKRRRVKYSSLDEVMADVGRLLDGHRTVGQWSLGMICNHLRVAFELSMDGFSEQAPWLIRRTVGAVAGRYVLWSGWIPRGMPVPGGKSVLKVMDAAEEAAGLAEAIVRFQAFSGPVVEHPMLGRFSKRQWGRFHCVHCAHHLSFVHLAGRDNLA